LILILFIVLILRPEDTLHGRIIREPDQLAAASASIRQHAGQAGKEIYASAMRALLARDIEGELQFVLRAAQIGQRNGAQHKTALVAREIGYVPAFAREEQTALRIPEIRVRQDVVGIFVGFRFVLGVHVLSVDDHRRVSYRSAISRNCPRNAKCLIAAMTTSKAAGSS
jgi:hypothetical protein